MYSFYRQDHAVLGELQEGRAAEPHHVLGVPGRKRYRQAVPVLRPRLRLVLNVDVRVLTRKSLKQVVVLRQTSAAGNPVGPPHRDGLLLRGHGLDDLRNDPFHFLRYDLLLDDDPLDFLRHYLLDRDFLDDLHDLRLAAARQRRQTRAASARY